MDRRQTSITAVACHSQYKILARNQGRTASTTIACHILKLYRRTRPRENPQAAQLKSISKINLRQLDIRRNWKLPNCTPHPKIVGALFKRWNRKYRNSKSLSKTLLLRWTKLKLQNCKLPKTFQILQIWISEMHLIHSLNLFKMRERQHCQISEKLHRSTLWWKTAFTDLENLTGVFCEE